MGEYAIYNGERIKIGTCESMYYLRADQRHLVHGGDLEHAGARAYWQAVRFRFPFPDEDNIEPGGFENHDRGVRLDGLTPPEGVEHYDKQFAAQGGYLAMLPCPESGAHDVAERPGYSARVVTLPDGGTLGIALNGYSGGVKLTQQRLMDDGRLCAVVECGGCGTAWRLETLADAQPAIDGLIAEAENHEHTARVGPHYRTPDGSDEAGIAHEGAWYRKLADRIAAGYAVSVPA